MRELQMKLEKDQRTPIGIGEIYQEKSGVPLLVTEVSQRTVTFMRIGKRAYCSRKEFVNSYQKLELI